MLVLVTHDVIHGHGHGLELGPSITEALLMLSFTETLVIELVVKNIDTRLETRLIQACFILMESSATVIRNKIKPFAP